MTYLLNKKYIQATKLLETIISFSNKYKHFFTKSFQYENIIKQLDRAIQLLCICLSLNQIPINAQVKGMITDKYNERFEKLLKYDKACFEECFIHGCSKMTNPLQKSDDFKTNGFLENTPDPMVATVVRFSTEFSKSQILNNVEGILDLYPRISFEKFSRIMKIGLEECKGILKDFQDSKSIVLTDSVFDQKVISKIVQGVKFITFNIEGDEIVVGADIMEESHVMFFKKQFNQLESIISKIEDL